MTNYLSAEQPHVLAHRGFAGTHPENSLSAFEAALDAGATHIETDVHLSMDGQVVIFHDDTFQGKPILEWNRFELPAWVPTMDEALVAFPHALFNVDVKSAFAAAPLAEIINRHRAHERLLVTSFSRARRRAVLSRLSQPVPQSASAQEFVPALLAAKLGWHSGVKRFLRNVEALQIPTRVLSMKTITARTMKAYQRAGVFVHVWTVNDPDEMRNLLKLGVHGVVTDDTPTAVSVLRGRAKSS